MQRPTRTELRIARTVRRKLAERHRESARPLDGGICTTERLERLQVLLRRLGKAQRRRWDGAVRRLRQRAARLATDLQIDLQHLSQNLGTEPGAIPTGRQVLEELNALEAEFGGWAYERRSQTLAVRTEPIELEGIYLGPFEIRLHLEELEDLRGHPPYSILAVDPQPAAANDQVTHPHVSDETLCAGEAARPIRLSLEAGRLVDFCQLVASVLRHYNPGSPYVRIEDWHGEPCFDCGASMHEDDRILCEGCEREFCLDCIACCYGCETSVCRGCLARCLACREFHCDTCLHPCARCGGLACEGCRDEDDHCPTCHKEIHDEQEEHQEDEEFAEEHDESHQQHQTRPEAPALEATAGVRGATGEA